tara:strand:+ start:46933 stop:47613 length:681 start_codon:yes stop_codon:yes gene_type:complete
MKVGVLLSGCGVYDGAEIHEAVLTLLAIEEAGAEAVCIGIDRDQHHVVNHMNGEEQSEKRNMLIEASRIARGDIKEINDVEPADIDMLVIPGGFGSAKNFTTWAFDGPEGEVLPQVKLLLVNMVNIGKPVVALCVSPVVVAKSFEDSEIKPFMTIGTDQEESPYDIGGFTQGLEATGAKTAMKTNSEINIDEANKIITAPCYMMETNLSTLRQNIKDAIEAGLKMV